jgi:Flp pilus assembly protein TadG
MRFIIVRWLIEIRSMLACRRGAVAIIFALAAMVLMVAMGMGVDLWQAYAVQARLQSAVDAAALAIASTDRTQFTDTQLQARVQAYVTSNYPTSALGKPGTPTLSYGSTTNIINISGTASVSTSLMRIVGIDTLSVSATGQAKAAWPNIDFYLLLDSSPSMAIPATQAGIDLMIKNTNGTDARLIDPRTGRITPQQEGGDGKGCAFGCHQTNPSGDSLNNINQTTGKVDQTMDNYKLAQQLGVTLRIDNLRQAAKDLMDTAKNTMITNNATYQMAIYTFDVAFNAIQALTTDLTAAQTAAANIQLLTMYTNGHLHNGDNNNDQDTDYDNAMTKINAAMSNPGHGTKSPGDTPKEVLFFVTDGVEDQKVGSCTTSATVDCSGNRQESVMDPGWCTTIKDRGIVIAVLYTEYLPLPTNSWYVGHVSKYQPNIATALQNCATQGLYFKVQTGGDISGALNALFLLAVNSVFLSR